MLNTVRQKTSGFTIVELLIVIVVIGILAAIVIVAFNGVQARANDTAVQADLRNFHSIMQQHKVLNGSYPATLTADMGIKFTREAYGKDTQGSGYNARYCRDAANDEYVILVNTKGGKYFKISSLSGKPESNPLTFGYGVCRLIDLIDVNPQANGRTGDTWAAWVN